MTLVVPFEASHDSLLERAVALRSEATRPAERRVARFCIAGIALGGLSALLGASVVLGWLLGLPRLTQIDPDYTQMKFNAGLAYLLVGTLVLTYPLRRSPRSRAVRMTIAAALLLMLLVTIGGYAFDVHTWIDNPLGLTPVQPEGFNGGRMALMTAVGLAALTVAILVLEQDRVVIAQGCAVAALSIGLTGLVGYLFDVGGLYQVGLFAGMAVHAAGGLALAGVGVLLLRSDTGPFMVVTGNSVGGLVIRRLAPAVLAGPLALGAVLYVKIRSGELQQGFALAVFVSLVAVVGTLLLWFLGRSLQHLDVRRAGAEDAFSLLEESLATQRELLERLDLVNRDLHDFAGVAAHDLKTPLSVVHGYADLLLETMDPVTGAIPDAGRLIGRINAAALRGSDLVDNLLVLASGHEGTAAEMIDLTELLRSVHEEQEIVRGRAATLELADLPCIEAPAAQLRQAFANLVGNALKYVPTDRTPILRVWSEAGPTPDLVRVCLDDNGDGIAPEGRDAMFEMFSRGANPTGAAGSGIGLAVVRRAVDRLGGNVTLGASPSGGLRVDLLLPVTHGGPMTGGVRQSGLTRVNAEVEADRLR